MLCSRNGGRARTTATVLAFALTVHATAEAAPFELSWSAPDGCPSRDRILAETRAELGEPPSDDPPKLFVQGRVIEDKRGFVVTLTMTDAGGHPAGGRRVRVDKPNCEEIATPTALVLAMMIAVARSSSSETKSAPAQPTPPGTEPSPDVNAPVETKPPAATSPSPAPPTRASPPEPTPTHRVHLGAAGSVSRGVLPNTGFGAVLRAGYAWRSLAFGIEGAFEDGGIVRAGSGSIDFQLAAIAARVGVSVVQTARIELVPTIAVSVARIGTSAAGFPVVHDDARATFLVGPGILARFPLAHSFSLEVLPEVEGVLARDRFALRADETLFRLHRPSAVAGKLTLGVSYRFD